MAREKKPVHKVQLMQKRFLDSREQRKITKMF